MKLPKINRESGLLVLIILLLGVYIGVRLFTPEVVTETTVTTKETSDTTYRDYDVTFSEKATQRKPIKPITVKPKTKESPEPEKYDSTRSYSGTYHFDYGKFDWQINTGGILEGYEFKPSFSIPTVTHTKEKTITQTRTIIQKGIFVGGGVDSQRDFNVGATYLRKNFLIEYNFHPAQGFGTVSEPIPVHQVGFKYKLF
ncbi:MAG TPA: hypothetical protein DHU93_07725 [Algoriphagus sp.]|nr:hypothetical protein [Algoriphagus sp.]